MNLPLEGESIQVDFGSSPAVGYTFLVDQVINVFDILVLVRSVSLETGTEMSMDENPQPFEAIRYVLDMDAPIGNGRVSVYSIVLVEAIHELFPLNVPGGGMAGSGLDPETGEFSRLMASYWIPETAELLTGGGGKSSASTPQ